jgi:hypothetical protein
MLILKVIIGATLGAAGGGAIGYLGKCKSGMCPLTSNPYMGAIWGAVLGALIVAAVWK